MEEQLALTPGQYQLIAESMSDLVCLHKPNGDYTWVSPSSRRILGYAPEELIGRNPYTLFHPEDLERIRESTHEPALDGEGNIYIRYRIQHKKGDYLWLESLTQPILDEGGNVTALHTTSRDVTEQVRLEEELKKSEILHRSVVDSLNEAVIIFSADGTVIAFNQQAPSILKMSADELRGRHVNEHNWRIIRLDGSPYPIEEQPIYRTLNHGEYVNNVDMGIEHEFVSEPLWYSVNSAPVTSAEGGSHPEACAVATIQDISDRVRNQSLLQQWASVFAHCSEPILIIDENGAVLESNPAFMRMVDVSTGKSTHRRWSWFVQGRGGQDFDDQEILETAKIQGQWRGELWLRDCNGQLNITWVSVSKMPNVPGSPCLYSCIFSQFKEKHEEHLIVQHQATHDALTGLPNRILLTDRFDMALRTAHRHNGMLGCIYIDLDDFKPINDTYGHEVGDQVLKALSRNLESALREEDTLARMGGDEFVVLIPSLSSAEQFETVVEKVCQTTRKVVIVGRYRFQVSASLGMSMYPRDGQDLQTLLRRADEAMYEAKRSGGGGWRQSGASGKSSEQ